MDDAEMMQALLNGRTAVRKNDEAWLENGRLNSNNGDARFPYPSQGWVIKKRTVYVNLYDHPTKLGQSGYIKYDTEEQARAHASKDCWVVAVPVEVDE